MSELVSTRIRSTAAKMGYLEFLDLVLAEELAVRDDRRFRQGLRLSKLPHHKTLDEYDFAFQPELDPREIKDLATLAFVEAKANAALLGPAVIDGLIAFLSCCHWSGCSCDRCDVVSRG
ncbi:ATP-binding protein [Streptomyces sp. AP-93]|nr:ATP-binding protein [Streptomyces sp. AP-93]